VALKRVRNGRHSMQQQQSPMKKGKKKFGFWDRLDMYKSGLWTFDENFIRGSFRSFDECDLQVKCLMGRVGKSKKYIDSAVIQNMWKFKDVMGLTIYEQTYIQETLDTFSLPNKSATYEKVIVRIIESVMRKPEIASALKAAAWRIIMLHRGQMDDSKQAREVFLRNWLNGFIRIGERMHEHVVMYTSYCLIYAVIKAIAAICPQEDFIIRSTDKPLQGFVVYCYQQIHCDLTGIVLQKNTIKGILTEFFFYPWNPLEPDWPSAFSQTLAFATTQFSPAIVKAQGLPKLRSKMDVGRTISITNIELCKEGDKVDEEDSSPDSPTQGDSNHMQKLPNIRRSSLFSLKAPSSAKGSSPFSLKGSSMTKNAAQDDFKDLDLPVAKRSFKEVIHSVVVASPNFWKGTGVGKEKKRITGGIENWKLTHPWGEENIDFCTKLRETDYFQRVPPIIPRKYQV